MREERTIVDAGRCAFGISKNEGILILGSCFATNVGQRLAEEGYDVCINPFGTIFNPASIMNSLERLENGEPFTEKDCVMMGAGADLWCSFSHYTKFARASREEFLENANIKLEEASAFWRRCSKVLVTFGTAWAFTHIESGKIVSNCLKRPAREFDRHLLDMDAIVAPWADFAAKSGKDYIFTVSPIRHMADGAHGNQISKSTLLLATDRIVSALGSHAAYFPAYETVLDELRDYRFYAEDRVHPSDEAIELIWQKFKSFALFVG